MSPLQYQACSGIFKALPNVISRLHCVRVHVHVYVHVGHLRGLYVPICSSVSLELEIDKFLGSCIVLLYVWILIVLNMYTCTL